MIPRSSIAILVLMIVALFFAQPSARAAQRMVFYWNELNLPVEQCVQRAAAALTQAGFAEQHNRSPFMIGVRGDYSAMYFCGTHKGLITLVVAGPDEAVSGAFITSISTTFPGQRR